MKTATLAALGVLISATPAHLPAAHAAGTDSARWKLLSRWDIRVDASLGNGCFMLADYPNANGQHTALRVGLNAPQMTGYVLLINNNWQSLILGQSYPIEVRFDGIQNNGWATWPGVASRLAGGAIALVMSFSNRDIWNAITYGSAIHLAYQGQPLLDGTLLEIISSSGHGPGMPTGFHRRWSGQSHIGRSVRRSGQ